MSDIDAQEMETNESNFDSDWDSITDDMPESEGDSESIEAAPEDAPAEVEATDVNSDIETNDPTATDTEQVAATPAEEVREVELSEDLVAAGFLANEEGALGKMIKVDGEEQFVNIEDLGKDYSGQKAIQSRFNEIDNSNKQLQTQNEEFSQRVEQVNGWVNTFRDKMSGDGGPVEGMQYLGELSGMPPHTIKEQLLAALAPEIERRSLMSPAELQNEQLSEQNAWLQNKHESDKAAREEEQAQFEQTQELQKSIASARETHSISGDDWDNAVDELIANENIANDSISAEFVSDYVRYDRADLLAEDVINKVEPGLLTNDEFYGHVMDYAFKNNDAAKVEQYIRETLNVAVTKQASDNLSKKISTKFVAQKAARKEVSEEDMEDVLDWDDL